LGKQLGGAALENADCPHHYATADEPTLRDRAWIEQQWDIGRLKAKDSPKGALLVLDEIQKIPGWSDVVKLLWTPITQPDEIESCASGFGSVTNPEGTAR